MSYFPSITTTPSALSADAFGRQRVSEPQPQIDAKHLYDKLPYIFDEVVNGTATATYNSANKSVDMSVTTLNDYAIRQTFQRGNYQTGKGLVFQATFSDFAPQTNVTKRVGYFNSSTVAPYNTSFDGIYLESTGAGVTFNIAKNGTITSYAQVSWENPLVDINWNNAQIFTVDIQWLGVGTVRQMFQIGGQTIIANTVVHANSVLSVYMSSPNHSIRYEIRSTGGAGSFSQICSTVYTDGASENKVGLPRAFNNGGISLAGAFANTRYGALGVRFKSSALDAQIILDSISFYSSSNDSILIEAWLNPTVTGTFTYTPIADSPLEVAIGTSSPTMSGGLRLGGEYCLSSNVISSGFENARRIGASIAGVADTLVITATPITAGLSYFVNVDLVEII